MRTIRSFIRLPTIRLFCRLMLLLALVSLLAGCQRHFASPPAGQGLPTETSPPTAEAYPPTSGMDTRTHRNIGIFPYPIDPSPGKPAAGPSDDLRSSSPAGGAADGLRSGRTATAEFSSGSLYRPRQCVGPPVRERLPAGGVPGRAVC